MFREFFDWFCTSLLEVFKTMDKFILFDEFSYFDFVCGLLATGIIFKLLGLILAIEDEEALFAQPDSNGNYIHTFDGYAPKHYDNYKAKHGPYTPKHEKKKRGWF